MNISKIKLKIKIILKEMLIPLIYDDIIKISYKYNIEQSLLYNI